MKSIAACAVLMIIIVSVVTAPNTSQQSNAGKSHMLINIHILLSNVSGNAANYSIQVSMGDEKGNMVTDNRTVWTGSQICPDDVDSLCYTDAGTFAFKGFKKGADIKVCNQPSYLGAFGSCESFEYNGKNEQMVRMRVVPMDPAHVPYYDPLTNKMVYP